MTDNSGRGYKVEREGGKGSNPGEQLDISESGKNTFVSLKQ